MKPLIKGPQWFEMFPSVLGSSSIWLLRGYRTYRKRIARLITDSQMLKTEPVTIMIRESSRYSLLSLLISVSVCNEHMFENYFENHRLRWVQVYSGVLLQYWNRRKDNWLISFAQIKISVQESYSIQPSWTSALHDMSRSTCMLFGYDSISQLTHLMNLSETNYYKIAIDDFPKTMSKQCSS